MSAVTRFKQSVIHGKERKAHQPSPASAWATPCTVLTCTAYVCLVTPSDLGVGLPLSHGTFPASMPTLPLSTYVLHYAPQALRPGHHNTQPVLPSGNLLSFALLVPS
ncbi:hypothetical protein E2C01_056744 [Portunus trituberculatus]|uniref:Uncharacterized protein n=1 Tax=Portunus trituberculatus TaxID=210409 RepID=A0A5B7GZ20_PORTR|nr:hypothetical protein [Portunus trituberculatus]